MLTPDEVMALESRFMGTGETELLDHSIIHGDVVTVVYGHVGQAKLGGEDAEPITLVTTRLAVYHGERQVTSVALSTEGAHA